MWVQDFPLKFAANEFSSLPFLTQLFEQMISDLTQHVPDFYSVPLIPAHAFLKEYSEIKPSYTLSPKKCALQIPVVVETFLLFTYCLLFILVLMDNQLPWEQKSVLHKRSRTCFFTTWRNKTKLG